jgi:nucleoside phosphorylase
MSNVTVFISYSHDSDDHRKRVLGLSERLRSDGILTLLDQYVNGSPVGGWPSWMLNQLDAASFVLVVCTETYYRRFRGKELPGKGKGVDWEAMLITQEIYDSRSQTLKFVPVFLSAAVESWIPEPLRSGTRYALTSEKDYQSLLDFLAGRAGVEPGPVGTLESKPRRKGTPLAFGASEPHAPPVDVSRIIKYAPSELVGRKAETKVLSDAWNQAVAGEKERPRILTFVALGGEGKTSLVAKWVAGLASQDWPGCDTAFAWSFYSQGTREHLAASSDLFLKEALTFFGDPALAGSAQGAFDKGRRLAQLVGERRALLILDGLEPLQYAPTSPTQGELKDQGIAVLLKDLAANSQGLCLVTTRYSIPDLRAFWQTTAPKHELARLSTAAGVSLLRKLGVVTGGQEDFEHLVEEVGGHALTLQIMGGYLKRAFAGDVRCHDRVRFEKADAKVQGGHAFRAMAAYGKWMEDESDEARRELAILRLMGLFDRPATGDCIAALRAAPAIAGLTEPLVGLAEEDWNASLEALASAKLLAVHRAKGAGTLLTLDAHPLLREYFGQRLRDTQPEAWRAAHRRLYEHLLATTKEGKEPTLEDLQPLYQAVAHGCQAGLQREARDNVYRDRILRGTSSKGFYSTRKLGAFGSDLGAVACFFETPWSRVSPALTEADPGWLLSEAATRLRGLGRLTEALEPMRAGLEMGVRQENWRSAAARASNLSELELTLGEVAAAVKDAEQSVTYADRSGDAFLRMVTRGIQADALHQAGQRAEAEVRFREAEQMQAEREPQYPLLYSLGSFLYCDLLLAEAEREAGKARGEARQEALLAKCHAVAERVAKMFDPSDPLLSIALDRLTLGRAALYAVILESRSRREESAPPPPASQSGLSSTATEIDRAVSGLRRAGQQDELPLGLLTRAWLRSLTRRATGPDSAQSDLDEASEIAERGPMPLFLADIHLYRARLFLHAKPYPWQSPQHDLAEARRLILKHGYLRRKGELEDAESWIGRVPTPKPSTATTPSPPQAAPPAIQANIAETRKAPMATAATIVLVTVNDLETKAVLDSFVGAGRVPAQETKGGVTYNLLGNHGGMSIVHTIAEMGAGGVGAAQQRTRQAIEHWKPAAVVAIGIAFGMDETKQKIGDVLVSTQIQDYELGKLGSDGTLTPRGAKPDASDVLRNRLRQTDATHARQSSDWPKVRFGLVLSGQKLVDNLDYRESLKRQYVEAIGGEMEATGLYVSAVTAKVDWIVVKAICDWGHDKSRPEKDAWQALAAKNAVRVLKAAIELGNPFADDEPSSAGKANGVLPTPPRSSAPAPASPALSILKEKLEFLQAEEAIAVDPAAKFKIRKDIEEAKAKIREYGGEA